MAKVTTSALVGEAVLRRRNTDARDRMTVLDREAAEHIQERTAVRAKAHVPYH
jgi:hypothetical protein